MNNVHPVSIGSRIILSVSGFLILTAIFLPIWRIELYAPQYPEGLALLINADGLSGDVEIINGLNHYIGMKELHSEEFLEFTILPWLLTGLGVMLLLAAAIGRKRVLYGAFAVIVVFGLLAFSDFYRWNYNYGHDLDPNAAIKVPGMAYQPPVLGFKQLLNFGAYSIPATGGWFFIVAGSLLLLAVLYERGWVPGMLKRKMASIQVGVMITGLIFLTGCASDGPKPIRINADMCAFCKMSVSDIQYAAQLRTDKGRHYFFDDILCMAYYKNEHQTKGDYYVVDFTGPGDFIPIDEATLLESEAFRSPMGGNTAAFSNPDTARHYQAQYGASEVQWEGYR